MTNWLDPKVHTVTRLLKQAGYVTGHFGKWHLGSGEGAPEPGEYNIDEYCTIVSNGPQLDGRDDPYFRAKSTTQIVDKTITFIEKNKDKPFFLYLQHTMPHVPLYVSDKFKGKSQQGLYGDVIMEIDWSVGQILSTLERLGIDEETLVIFTSDNGPWLPYGDHAGSAGPLREGKGTTFEGGQREPCIMRWPGKVPAGAVCSELATTMDIMPTMAKLTGASLPNRPIDGRDIWPLMSGQEGSKTPYTAFAYYRRRRLWLMVPTTISMSAWRGEKRGNAAPNRSRS